MFKDSRIALHPSGYINNCNSKMFLVYDSLTNINDVECPLHPWYFRTIFYNLEKV